MVDANKEVDMAIMKNFFKELDIKYLGEKTIEKLYDSGYHSSIDIIQRRFDVSNLN